jgi:hypothetical protein
LNGVKQLVGTDVTATSGTSVVFATGTTVNDIVEIVGYGTFVLADHLTQTQSDARYVNVAGDTMTGALTTTGLTVDGDANLSGTAVNFDLDETDTTDLNTRFRQSAGQLFVQTLNDAKSLGANRLNINHTTGDISFYNDSGNAKFFWDASSESLGLGTTSPTADIHMVKADDINEIIMDANRPSAGQLLGRTRYYWNGTEVARMEGDAGSDTTNKDDGILRFLTRPSGSSMAERMRITAAGKIGIGTEAPQGTVVVQASDAKLGVDNDGSKHLEMGIGTGGCSFMMTTGHTMAFGHQPYANRGSDTNFSEAMRLTSSGNLALGDPNSEGYKLEVSTQNNAANLMLHKRAAAGTGLATNLAMQVTQTNGQSARLAEIGSNFASGWGGELHFSTKSANGSPNNSTTERMKIDAAGRVTMPYQPAFWVRRNGDQTGYHPGYYNHSVIYNYKEFDVGNNVSTTTGLFTAPVNGIYIFFASAYSQTHSWSQAWFTVNGGRGLGSDFVKSSTDSFVNASVVLKLSANDTVGYHPYAGGTNATIIANENHTWFRGSLLG